MVRPRIAWCTPLQPVESGISLYSEDLLPLLSEVLDIDVIVDGYAPSTLRESHWLKVRNYRRFRPDDYDLIVYQVGNSPAHMYFLDDIRRSPGLLVLHDTVLNHLFIQHAARNRSLLDYRAEMERRYGEPGGRAAERVLKGQAPDDLFRFPMSESLIQFSGATLVHSEYARSQAEMWAPGATIWRVPHGLRMPENVSREAARRALGIPEDQFIIASISHINPHKRIDVVLRALKRLRRSIPARLILAGSVSPNFPLARMVSHLELDQVVEHTGYVRDREARLIAAAADVIVNLRYPTAGETSGSLLHSMAAGRPVLVSHTGSFSEVPEDAAVRIPVDALEEQMLVAVFKRLAHEPDLKNAIGRRARQFIKTEHSLERWVEGYIEAIEQLLDKPVDRPKIAVPEEHILEPSENASVDDIDELTASLARDIAELGLGGDELLLENVARSRVELGLGVGMISDTKMNGSDRSGDLHDRSERKTD
ncbi:MAG: glycosyltransferase family 4 protein [Thermomicrobiaceae bacterium]